MRRVTTSVVVAIVAVLCGASSARAVATQATGTCTSNVVWKFGKHHHAHDLISVSVTTCDLARVLDIYYAKDPTTAYRIGVVPHVSATITRQQFRSVGIGTSHIVGVGTGESIYITDVCQFNPVPRAVVNQAGSLTQLTC